LAPVSLSLTWTVRAWMTSPFAGVMMVSLAALPGRGEVEGPGGPLAAWPLPPHAAADKMTATATKETLTSLIAPPPRSDDRPDLAGMRGLSLRGLEVPGHSAGFWRTSTGQRWRRRSTITGSPGRSPRP
jgi:hypothetical protein